MTPPGCQLRVLLRHSPRRTAARPPSVGVPTAWDLARWHAGNVWESEDGPSRRELCARDDYWNHSAAWLDDRRVAIAGIGEDDTTITPGARVFDVLGRDPTSTDDSVPLELLAFPGPAGPFFAAGGWLFSSSDTGLSRWDPTTGERTGQLSTFRPTHHHRGARELVALIDRHLVRLALPASEDLELAGPATSADAQPTC